MPLPPRCRVLIFDLGDVLFSWSPMASTSISPKLLKRILSSTVWGEYECQRHSEDDCYRLVGEKFSLDPAEVCQAVVDARASLVPDNAFIDFIRELQAEAQGTLRIFAMSNMSAPDYEVIRGKPADWSIFERVFTSADASMRKPDLCFYKFVLDEIKADPTSVAFVDDKFENVFAARSLGINGIVFDDVKHVRQALRYLVSEPEGRGLGFLKDRAGRLESETSFGQTVPENFSQLLILEATSDRKLVNYVHHSRTWNFFKEKPLFTTDEFPPDLDTTSVGLMITQPDDDVVHSVLDEILQYRTEDGINMIYFDPERAHTDPVVSLNVLSLFYSRGRGHELASTLDWVLGVLAHRAYLDGTRYYETAECFLFFAARLLRTARDDAGLQTHLAPLLRERVLERAGCPGNALALAMRVMAGAAIGLRMERDLEALLPLQWEDGGWEPSWVYRYGSTGGRLKLGNRGLTTAFALNAIAALYPGPQKMQDKEWQEERGYCALATAMTVTMEAQRPQIQTTGLVWGQQHCWAPMGIQLPPSSLISDVQQQKRRDRGFSATAIARGVYAYLFPSISSPPLPPQARTACMNRSVR